MQRGKNTGHFPYCWGAAPITALVDGRGGLSRLRLAASFVARAPERASATRLEVVAQAGDVVGPTAGHISMHSSA
jgi:hypothetical protein